MRPFGLPNDEITQVTQSTHVSFLNFQILFFFEKSQRLHQSHLLVWLLIWDHLDSLLMKSHKLHESHMLQSLIFWRANIFWKSHRSYTNHTSLLEYQYETFGLPYDEITQVTWITHVTVPNLLNMNIFWEITEVTPSCSSFDHKIKKSHCHCDNDVSKFHFHPFSCLKRWLKTFLLIYLSGFPCWQLDQEITMSLWLRCVKAALLSI